MNTTRRTIAKNASFLMLAQLGTWLLTMVNLVFLTRYLGAEDVGRIHLATSIWAIMGLVVELGTELLITKEVARAPEKLAELIGTSIVLRVIAFVIGFGLVAQYTYTVEYGPITTSVIFVIGISSLVSQIGGNYQAALQGLERMEFFSLSDVTAKTITLFLTIIFLVQGYGVLTIAFITIVGALVNMIIPFIAVKRMQSLRFKFRWSQALWMLKASFPYLLISIFLVLYVQMDVVILSLLLNEEAIGWYSAADRLFGTLLFIPSVFITAVFPALSRMYTDGSGTAIKLIQKSFDLMLILSIPIGLGTILVSHSTVILLFGEEFSNSGQVLAVLGVVLIFTYQNVLIGRYFISIDRQNSWTVVMAVATIATIPLDLIFVPFCQARFGNGAIGGAVSFVITESGMLITGLFMLPRKTFGLNNVWVAARAGIAGAVMMVVTWPLRHMFILIPILVGGITYLVLILGLRVIPEEDWLLLKSMSRNILARFRKPKSELPA